jgi:erythromycin esterase
MSRRLFQDRRDAGRVLAGLLDHYRGNPDVIVLGLPRGGVPVYEIATALGAPLDVFVVRKLGVPGREEVAMGAIASNGVLVLNDDVVRGLGIQPDVIQRVAEQEGRELLRREQVPAAPRAAEALRMPRLERAIGVIYRPETERQSHYFRARVADQFDAVIHIDQTRAVEPLERTARWEEGEPPETYPFAV